MITYESLLANKPYMQVPISPPILQTLSPGDSDDPFTPRSTGHNDKKGRSKARKSYVNNSSGDYQGDVEMTSSRSRSKGRHGVSRKHQSTEMEVALVNHIRKTIPLESLRELAAEIGFSVEDVQQVMLYCNFIAVMNLIL